MKQMKQNKIKNVKVLKNDTSTEYVKSGGVKEPKTNRSTKKQLGQQLTDKHVSHRRLPLRPSHLNFSKIRIEKKVSNTNHKVSNTNHKVSNTNQKVSNTNQKVSNLNNNFSKLYINTK
jgi:CII-binding regulator of phage lambda lysogenization HflD